jgi:hypothetical protein
MTDREYMAKLKLAVMSNTGRPYPEEMKNIKVEKKILTSPKMEKDSKRGMVLFCGLASAHGVSNEEIMDYLCIEGLPELEYKVDEFHKLMQESRRFQNKIILINNYLKLN